MHISLVAPVEVEPDMKTHCTYHWLHLYRFQHLDERSLLDIESSPLRGDLENLLQLQHLLKLEANVIRALHAKYAIQSIRQIYFHKQTCLQQRRELLSELRM